MKLSFHKNQISYAHMYLKTMRVILPLFLLLVNIQLGAQKKLLAASTPEIEGVSSEGILNFLNAAAQSKTEFHSFMMLRHGKIVAQGWWNPYSASLKHTMYSCSKSFTATAIGFAINEKRLSLNDKVISFFPKECPDSISPFLSMLRVKDVLSMSDGQDPDPTSIVDSRDSNWVRGFLATPIVYKPGSTFLYNSLGTYMLSAIVQKVTGQKVVDYLKPRLFEPLGIEGMDWEIDPKGINTGGWGLRIKTEDMAKFGQLFLQKGKWGGKQILPEGWASEASTAKIIQHPAYTQSKKDSSDWEQGYCYQMWRCRHNAFRGDGAYGQFIIVMPDEDAVIAITAETANMQEEINLVWQYLLPSMHSGILPENKVVAAKLIQRLSSLALPLPLMETSVLAKDIAGKRVEFLPNERHIKSILMNFWANNNIDVKLETDTATYQLSYSPGRWQKGITSKHGPSLTAAAKAGFAGLPPHQVAGAYTMQDDHTLKLILRYIESPHTEMMTFHFENDSCTLDIENSLDFGRKKVVLKGRVTN